MSRFTTLKYFLQCNNIPELSYERSLSYDLLYSYVWLPVLPCHSGAVLPKNLFLVYYNVLKQHSQRQIWACLHDTKTIWDLSQKPFLQN